MRFVDETAFVRLCFRHQFRQITFAIFAVVGAQLLATTSWADDAPAPNQAFYFEMRTPVVDPAPRYASASRAPVEGKSIAVAACDGNTYYLSLADGAAVRAAIANASIVQLQVAIIGDDPSTSRTVCVVQTGK